MKRSLVLLIAVSVVVLSVIATLAYTLIMSKPENDGSLPPPIIPRSREKAIAQAREVLEDFKRVTIEYVKKKYGLEITPPSKKTIQDFLRRNKFGLIAEFGDVYVLDPKTGKVVREFTKSDWYKSEVGDRILMVNHMITFEGEYIATTIREYVLAEKIWYTENGKRECKNYFVPKFRGWLVMNVRP